MNYRITYQSAPGSQTGFIPGGGGEGGGGGGCKTPNSASHLRQVESPTPPSGISHRKLLKLNEKSRDASQKNHHRGGREVERMNHQPFCCLKDWMEPEWCTIATMSWFPALIEFRYVEKLRRWGHAEHMGDLWRGCVGASRSSHPAKRAHGRCANPSNTCLKLLRMLPPPPSSSSSSSPSPTTTIHGCCHGDGR